MLRRFCSGKFASSNRLIINYFQSSQLKFSTTNIPFGQAKTFATRNASSNFFRVHAGVQIKKFEDTEIWHTMSEQEKTRYALAEDKPQSATIAYYQGLGFNDLGGKYYKSALAAFSQAIIFEPNGPYAFESHKQISDLLAEVGHFREAIEHQKIATALNSDHAYVGYRKISSLYLTLGREGLAIAYLRKACDFIEKKAFTNSSQTLNLLIGKRIDQKLHGKTTGKKKLRKTTGKESQRKTVDRKNSTKRRQPKPKRKGL